MSPRQRALQAMLAAGIALDPSPVDPHPGDCEHCEYHAFNAAGEELDGGTTAALASWIEQGYLSPAYIRPVRR